MQLTQKQNRLLLIRPSYLPFSFKLECNNASGPPVHQAGWERGERPFGQRCCLRFDFSSKTRSLISLDSEKLNVFLRIYKNIIPDRNLVVLV